MALDIIEQIRSPERQNLIDFVENSIEELTPIGRPRLVEGSDYFKEMDPITQMIKQSGVAFGRFFRSLKDFFVPEPSYESFRTDVSGDNNQANIQDWQRNPNYALVRLMRRVVAVLENSPAETLEQDIRTCISAFTKENPHLTMNIYDDFFAKVRACAKAEVVIN